MSIPVINLHAPLSRDHWYEVIYVGRSNTRCRYEFAHQGSVLANPFRITKGANRKNIIRRYERWLREQLTDPHSPQSLEIDRLRKLVEAGRPIVLACWCWPQPCHADVIARIIQDRPRHQPAGQPVQAQL